MPDPLMDLIYACLALVPVPGLCTAFSTFRSLVAAIGEAKWSSQQLCGLATSVAELLQILDGEIRKGKLSERQISAEMDSFQTYYIAFHQKVLLICLKDSCMRSTHLFGTSGVAAFSNSSSPKTKESPPSKYTIADSVPVPPISR